LILELFKFLIKYVAKVDPRTVHLEVGRLATFWILKLDESVLQAVAGLTIANHFAAENKNTFLDEYLNFK
jgi:hypothetical protein